MILYVIDIIQFVMVVDSGCIIYQRLSTAVADIITLDSDIEYEGSSRPASAPAYANHMTTIPLPLPPPVISIYHSNNK